VDRSEAEWVKVVEQICSGQVQKNLSQSQIGGLQIRNAGTTIVDHLEWT